MGKNLEDDGLFPLLMIVDELNIKVSASWDKEKEVFTLEINGKPLMEYAFADESFSKFNFTFLFKGYPCNRKSH